MTKLIKTEELDAQDSIKVWFEMRSKNIYLMYDTGEAAKGVLLNKDNLQKIYKDSKALIFALNMEI